MARQNLHATALVVGRVGLLICGAPGSGKTSLALALIAGAQTRGHFALLVADDQVWLRPSSGRLVAEAPEAIAGLVERYGLGPTPMPFMAQAVIDAMIMLVDEAAAPRLAEPQDETLCGITLPRLDLACRGQPGSSVAALYWLDQIGG